MPFQEMPVSPGTIDAIVQRVSNAITRCLVSIQRSNFFLNCSYDKSIGSRHSGWSTFEWASTAVSRDHAAGSASPAPSYVPPITSTPGPSSSTALTQTIMHNLLGISPAPLGLYPRQYVHPPSLNIDARVSEKIGGETWNHEYIDITCLLNNSVNKDRYQLTFLKKNLKRFRGHICPCHLSWATSKTQTGVY